MRCVHLDFHTSPDIPGIGAKFNKEEFTKTVREANVDLMTVFAKCHHGYTYYPSKVSTMHPGLDFNLLQAEIDAIHAAGAKAPIYITMGWSKKDADEHPEWHQIDFNTGKPMTTGALVNPPADPDAPLKHLAWVTLCPLGGYREHLVAITREICENFDELGIKKLEPSACDADFIKCDIDEITTPFLSYSAAYKVESDGEVLADCYEPYFNRTMRHFCGHKNTPYKTEKAEYPALVKRGNVMYFAHPVFTAYNDSGSYVLERYIMKGIDAVYDRGIVTKELPSAARIRLREGEDFLALHVLYSPPINRGNVCLLSDFPKLHDVAITLKTEKKITEAKYEPSGEDVPFTQNGDTVTLKLPPFSLHQLVILK